MRTLAGHLAIYAPTLRKVDIRVTGSTSNGWQHHQRTLASVSYTMPEKGADDVVTPTSDPKEDTSPPPPIAFERTTERVRELCNVVRGFLGETGRGALSRQEREERAEWMALHGLVSDGAVGVAVADADVDASAGSVRTD